MSTIAEAVSRAEVSALPIIAETLRKERLMGEGLKLLSVNHRSKVGLAVRLRQETTMDLKWIAREPGVGSWKYLPNLRSREARAANQEEFNLHSR